MARDLGRGFSSIFFAKVFSVAFSVLSTPILVRLLGSGSFGDYAFLVSVAASMMILMNGGTFGGLRKFIAEERPRTEWSAMVFGFYIRITIVLTLLFLAGLVIAIGSGIISNNLGQEFNIYFLLIGFWLFSRQIFTMFRSILMGFNLEHYSESLVVVKEFLVFIVSIGLILVGHGVKGALVGHVVGAIAASVLAFPFVRGLISVDSVVSKLPSDFPSFELAAFSLNIVLLSFLTASLYHVDVVLLRIMVGDDSTGYYKAALAVAQFLWLVPTALQTLFLHSTSKLWADGDKERITAIAARTTRYNALLTLLLGIGLAALARPFVILYYGEDFIPSTLPLIILLPGAFGFAVARPILSIGQGKGELMPLIKVTGIAALVNLILNLLLIPRYGMIGAATATSVGYFLMLVLHIFTANKLEFYPLEDIRIKSLVSTSILTASVVFLSSYLLDDPFISLFIIPLLGLFVFTTSALVFGAIDKGEINDIMGKIHIL